MKQVSVFLGLIAILFITSCRTFSPPASKEALENNKAYWFEYDATKRGAFVLAQTVEQAQNYRVKVISEPAPDVALQSVSEVLAKVTYEGVSAELKAKIAEEIIQLGGRTQAVLVLREALFRLSEVVLNKGMPDADVKAIFDGALKASEEIAKAEVEKQKTKQKEAELSIQKAQVELKQLELQLRNK